MEKKTWCEKEMDQNMNQLFLKITILQEMTLVTSKNHRNKQFEKFNSEN